MLHSTISSHYINVLLTHVKAPDVNPLLISSGIPVAIVNNPQIRVADAAFAKLLKHVQDKLADEGLGYYKVPQKINTTNILVSHMALADNVGRAFEHAADFYKILDLGIHLSTRINSERFALRLSIDEALRCHWLYEEVLTKIHRIIRWLANERIGIIKAKLPFAKPAHYPEYSLLFGAPTEFNCKHAEISVSLEHMQAPIRRSNTEIKAHFSDFRYRILSLSVDPKSYTERVRLAIKDNLPDDCSYETVSKQLALHPQTLRRRLHDEGTEFTTIKNDIIRDLAIELIGKRELSVKQIAFLLNFSTASSFNRAFKKWTSMSPIAFRDSLDELPETSTHITR